MSVDALAPEEKPRSGSIDAVTPQERAARNRAIFLMLGALACFACLDASAKYLGRGLPVLEVVGARYIVSALMALAVLNPLTAKGAFVSARPGLQIFRSTLLLLSTALNFFALRSLQLAETMSIGFVMPLAVALLAGPLLGEWVGPRRLAAIVVGFAGVLIVTRPFSGAFHPAMLVSLASVLCYALYSITTRKLAAHDSSSTTLLYSNLVGAVVLVVPVILMWQTPQDALSWGLMIFMGLAASVGHFLLIAAHRLAPAAVLAPFVYMQLVVMLALGWFVFGDWPGPTTLAGAGVVIGSGLYLLYRERVVKAG